MRRSTGFQSKKLLSPGMMRELQPGEPIEILAIYVGQVGGRHLFLINAFAHSGPHRLR